MRDSRSAARLSSAPADAAAALAGERMAATLDRLGVRFVDRPRLAVTDEPVELTCVLTLSE